MGDAEVGEERVLGARAAACDQDVGGLDVAVHEPGGVRVVQGVGDVGDDPHGPVGGHGSLAPQHLLRVVTLDELHGDPQPAVVETAVEDLDQGRVVERAGDRRLAVEPGGEHRVGRQVGMDHLHRVLPREPWVLHQVDRTHAAGADLLDDAVTGEDGPRFKVHLCSPIPAPGCHATLLGRRELPAGERYERHRGRVGIVGMTGREPRRMRDRVA